MPKIRAFFTAIACILPSPIALISLRMMGHKVDSGCRIGFSLVIVNNLYLERGCSIGSFNFLFHKRLFMRAGAYIGRQNIVYGPISVLLNESAAIGNNNKIVRGPTGSVTYDPSHLKLGNSAKITSDHRIDCTRSISIGKYGILAGSGSQIWTHGYVHDVAGPGRYRIDGNVVIEDNVYVGSSCIINLGVRIGAGSIIGAGTTVAKSLIGSNMYVSAPVRVLPRPLEPNIRNDLTEISSETLCERVFERKNSANDET